MILYICTKIRENNQRVSQLLNDTISIVKISKGHKSVARMVVQGKFVEPAICFSHLYSCEALIHPFIGQMQNNIMLRQQTFFFNIYEPKISNNDIYTSQRLPYCLTSKCDLDLQLT